MTEERKQELLEEACIIEAWREYCYITEEEMIFTPRFDEEGELVATGEQAYKEWLEQKDKPIEVKPSVEEKIIILEQHLADLEIAQIL